jgi:hypothetical protein
LPENPGHAVVAAGTERGNQVLAHLGAITDLPMAANCTQGVDNGGGEYAIVRQRWAGGLVWANVAGTASLAGLDLASGEITDVVDARAAADDQLIEIHGRSAVIAAVLPWIYLILPK